MAKEILFNMDARDQLKKGVDELANAVKVTLRPLGPNVTFTALASSSTPFLSWSRASMLNKISFAMVYRNYIVLIIKFKF